MQGWIKGGDRHCYFLVFLKHFRYCSSVETLNLQQIVKDLITEGTVPVPPNRPCILRLCRITFSGVISPGGCHNGGGGGITCRTPQRALRKIF
jgi:hypothetical protein